jgi:hypothetical protein
LAITGQCTLPRSAKVETSVGDLTERDMGNARLPLA